MVMSWIFTGIVAIAILFAILNGNGSALAAAVPQGAQTGVTLAISIAGSICLWSGIGKVMERSGITKFLSKTLSPILYRIFPSAKSSPILAGKLSGNICANFLGLGNAATPLGIEAAKRLAGNIPGKTASDELCRLIVLNTASIQLIPATVAALRVSLGCEAPFDILPAVWITSICSASAGLTAAWLMGRIWRR